jgi:hypothetical protein
MVLLRLIAIALLLTCSALSRGADAGVDEASMPMAQWMKELPRIRPMFPLSNKDLPLDSCDSQTTTPPRRPVCKVDVKVNLAVSLPSAPGDPTVVVCTAEIGGVLHVPVAKRDVNVVWTIIPATTPAGHSFEFAPHHGVLVINDPHEQIRSRLGVGIGGRGDDDALPNEVKKFFWRNKNTRLNAKTPIEPITYMPAVLWTRPNPNPTAKEPTLTELCRAIDPKIVNDG